MAMPPSIIDDEAAGAILPRLEQPAAARTAPAADVRLPPGEPGRDLTDTEWTRLTFRDRVEATRRYIITHEATRG